MHHHVLEEIRADWIREETLGKRSEAAECPRTFPLSRAPEACKRFEVSVKTVVAAEVQNLAPYPRQFAEIQFACRVVARECRHVLDEGFDESVTRVETGANLLRGVLHPGLHHPCHARERRLLRRLYGTHGSRHVYSFGLAAFMEQIACKVLRLDSIYRFDAAVPRGGATLKVWRSRIENRRAIVAVAPLSLIEKRRDGKIGRNHSVKALENGLYPFLAHFPGYEATACSIRVNRRLVERTALS